MILEAALTVLCGALVYVLGQAITKLVIEPMQHFQQILGRARYALVYHLNAMPLLLSDPDVRTLVSVLETDQLRQHQKTVRERALQELGELREVSRDLRGLASELHSSVRIVHPYWLMRLFCGGPRKKAVLIAADAMGGASNVVASDNSRYVQEMEQALDALGL